MATNGAGTNVGGVEGVDAGITGTTGIITVVDVGITGTIVADAAVGTREAAATMLPPRPRPRLKSFRHRRKVKMETVSRRPIDRSSTVPRNGGARLRCLRSSKTV